MLTLSRKPGQTIDIEGGISIHVVKIRGSRVQIAIEAPKELIITRREVTEQENGLSARTPATDSATCHSNADDS